MLKEIVSQYKNSYFVSSDLDFDKHFCLSLDRHFIYHYDDFGNLHYLAFYIDPDLCVSLFNEFKEYFLFSDFIRYRFPSIQELEGDVYYLDKQQFI